MNISKNAAQHDLCDETPSNAYLLEKIAHAIHNKKNVLFIVGSELCKFTETKAPKEMPETLFGLFHILCERIRFEHPNLQILNLSNDNYFKNAKCEYINYSLDTDSGLKAMMNADVLVSLSKIYIDQLISKGNQYTEIYTINADEKYERNITITDYDKFISLIFRLVMNLDCIAEGLC